MPVTAAGGPEAAKGAALLILATLLALPLVAALAAGRGSVRPGRWIAATLLFSVAMAAAAATRVGAAAFAAGAPLAALLLLTGAMAAALRSFGRSRGTSTVVAATVAVALLALPFIGDPLVERGGPGKSDPAVIDALVRHWPAGAAAGGGLGVDVLRAPLAYGTGGNGLSRIGAYHAHEHGNPWREAGLLALAALAAGALTLRPMGRERDPVA